MTLDTGAAAVLHPASPEVPAMDATPFAPGENIYRVAAVLAALLLLLLSFPL